MNTHKFSFLHRFLHWGIALTIIFILLTVFLRMGWMNKNAMGTIIFNDLQGKGITLSQEDTVKIAKDIRRPMFNWHIYAGYLLTGLYLARLLYIFIKRRTSLNSISTKKTIKQKFQSVVYIIFYIGLGIGLLSGLFIEVGPQEYKKIGEAIHKPFLYFMVVFLLIHFGGILIGEKTSEKGVVSAMINGGEKLEK